jgi:amidase
MARSAADLQLALDVVAGPEPEEAKGYRLDLPPPRHADLADFRILVLDQHPAVATDSEIRTAVDTLAGRLDALGAPVARSSELLPDLGAQHGVYMQILNAAISRGAPQGTTMNAHEWMNMLDAQMAFRRRWAALFEAFDVVIAPTFGVAAFPHKDEPEFSARSLMIDGKETAYGDQLAWPGVALLPNLPATVAPIGQTRSGLPIGAQIIGPYLEDRTTIAFAGLIEREFGGFRAPPSLP